MTLPASVIEGPRHRWWIVFGFAVLVTISTGQLWLEAVSAEGTVAPWAVVSIAWTNAVATLPWLPLAFGIFWLARRWPPTSTAGLALHGLASVGVALLFLTWLTAFHVVLTVAGGRFAELWWQNLGDFFTICLVVYWLIAFGALATRRSTETAVDAAVDDPDSGRRDATPSPIVIRSHGRTRLVAPASIEWIEADSGYARLHTADGSFLLRRSLADLARALGDSGFVRIHRASIVRLDLIVEVRPLDHGEARIVLENGHELKVSRTYRRALDTLGV